MYRTKDLESATGLKHSALHIRAAALPMQSEAKPRGARRWTFQDSVLLLVAQDLTDRGFPVRAALTLTAKLAPEVVAIVADEERDTLLVGWPDTASDADWSATVVQGTEAAIDTLLQHAGAMLVQPRPLIRNAMLVLMSIQQGARAHA